MTEHSINSALRFLIFTFLPAFFNVRPYLYGAFGLTIARDAFTEADSKRAPMYLEEFNYLWKLGKRVII